MNVLMPAARSARGSLGRLAGAIQAYERSQFSRPRGPAGWLVGVVLAVENRARNAWAVNLLDVEPTDHILEIGFGPGVAVQEIARRATHGVVAGVDHSAVMVAQARRRNAEAVRAGRVDLRLGSSTCLAYPDGAFDKVLTVNAIHLSPDLAAELREIRRVLKPGGRLVVVLQPVWVRGEPAVRAIADALAAQLATAGFQPVRLAFAPMRPVASIGAIASR